MVELQCSSGLVNFEELVKLVWSLINFSSAD
jgi:hypothetical protein